MLTVFQLFFIPALLLLRFLFSLSLTESVRGVSWTDATKWHHNLARLSDSEMITISQVTADYEDFNRTLDAILVPRVPGTTGHEEVRNYIVREMSKLGWTVEEDSFEGRTPHGRKPFSNVISTLNPDACRFLTIACHYDSMYNREYTFLGATDSAVPCSMMIHAARMLYKPLKLQQASNYDLTLQFIFFDGEEAFKRWSRTDSLYGSRHLAAKWNKMRPFPTAHNDGSHCQSKDYASYLDRMEVMVLLDLIGTANPKFYSYFPDTHGLYTNFVEIESRLNSLKVMEPLPPESRTNYFMSRSTLAFVEDDHIPFMKLGVPIVHVIPSPFPHVWHKESDNAASVHHPTVNNLNKILRAFIAEYLHLNLDIGKLSSFMK